MSILNKIVTRVFYYPSLGYSGAMRAAGLWRKWDRVDECVLLGGAPSRADLPILAGMGVTAIVNLCEEFKGHRREMESAGLTQCYLPTLDFHCPTREVLLRGVEFLLHQRALRRQTYVHCKVGRARSATVVLCYLIATERLTPADAYARLKAVRPQVAKNIDKRLPVVEAMDELLAMGAGENMRSTER